MALANDLPDAIITESGLKITPLDAAVPDTAQALINQTAMLLPHVKITELLLEVDEWTGFTRHCAYMKSGELAKDKNLPLSAILADAINLGQTRMAESCPGTTYAKLAWLQAWHIRDLGDTKLYIPKGEATYDALKPMIGGTFNIRHAPIGMRSCD